MNPARRAYATLGEGDQAWQIHYRSAGAGPPLVMLHPSPLHSASLAPAMAALAGQARCIALDLPGYGCSDPLPEELRDDRRHPGLDGYVTALGLFLDALKFDAPILYGSATGAQVAIEFSKAHPQRCAGLLLENVAVFTAGERERLLAGYFPDIRPRADGSHLTRIWRMARQGTRYFPWHAADDSGVRRDGFAAPEVVNAIVLAHLLAGPTYDHAYRAAFANETAERLRAVTVPAAIVLWADGMLGDYGERVAQIDLPGNFAIRRAGSGMATRQAALKAAAELFLRH